METILREFTEILSRSSVLMRVSEREASERPAAGKWSKKETLGHLIDSAANNHQRFVRLQYESLLEFPGYRQDRWVELQNYQDRGWAELVDFWILYNRHLRHLLAQVDVRTLDHVWQSPTGPMTLRVLMMDYLVHAKHHLAQVATLNAQAAGGN